MDESALTEPTVIDDLNITSDIARSSTITEEESNKESTVEQPSAETETIVLTIDENATSIETVTDGLRAMFPSMRKTLPVWIASVKELADRANESYLSQGSDSESTRTLCEDIPRLLNACIQSLSRATGAFIDARAVWYDYSDPPNLRAYSTLSVQGNSYITTEDAIEEMAYFIHMICTGAGPYLERQSFNAFPTVYSSLESRGRPMLPPAHPNLKQRAITLNKWFSILRRWQGLPSVSWADVGRAISNGSSPHFAFSRTPGGLPWGEPLTEWSEVQIERIYMYIRTHQARLQAGDQYAQKTAFQWLEKDPNEPLRTEPAVELEDLYWAGEATYTLAMEKHHFKDDCYIELTDQPRRWFTSEFIAQNKEYFTKKMLELMYWIELNEKLDPPVREPQDNDPALLRVIPLHLASVGRPFREIALPSALYDQFHDLHDDYNMRALWVFIVKKHGMCVDGKVPGGPTGIVRFGLCILLIGKLIEDIHQRRVKLEGSQYQLRWDYNEGRNLITIVETIVEDIKKSRDSLHRPVISQSDETHRWKPAKIVFERQGEDDKIEIEWPHGIWGTDRADAISRVVTRVVDPLGSAEPVALSHRPGSSLNPQEGTTSSSQALQPVSLSTPIEIDDDDDDLYADFPESGTTKHSTLPNPYLPPPPPRKLVSGNPHPPSTVRAEPAELPPDLKEGLKRRSLSMSAASGISEASTGALGLHVGATGLPNAVDLSFAPPESASTPLGRGRPLVREKEQSYRVANTVEPPSESQAEGSRPVSVKLKRPAIKTLVAPVGERARSAAGSSGASRTPREPPSTLPAADSPELLASATSPIVRSTEAVGENTMAGSMLGAFAKSAHATSSRTETRASATNILRRPLTRQVKRRHAGSEEDGSSAKPGSKKGRSASRGK